MAPGGTSPLEYCCGCDQPAFKCDCVGIERRRADAAEAKAAALAAELARLRDRSGCRQRQCPTCRGGGYYPQPGDLTAKCPSCDGGYHWVFSDQFAAQLAEQRDAQLARLAALCRRLIDHLWSKWPEDARESLRRSNPEHAVVRAEAELREIEGGGTP